MNNAVLIFFNRLIIVYVFLLCITYLLLFFAAFFRLKREIGLHKIEPYKRLKESAFTAPLSILVPVYNEEVGVIGTILSLVTGSGRLDYPQFEVIVINDGSKDLTLQKVIDRFEMKVMKHKVIQKRNGISTKKVRNVYQSAIYPFLYLIDKENGGKADALNAGINLSNYPYFASIDGDTILDTDSFLKIMKPIIENSDEEIIAIGGNVLIANGSHVSHGKINEMRLTKHPLVIMQIIEYVRAFLIGRIGLSQKNLLLIISGAFGVFNTSRVIQVGGYLTNTIGEDMELVVRLHEKNIEHKWGARIEYVADPVCYTEAPESFAVLRTQRVRWHRGLFESLWAHRKMIFNFKYGAIGFVAMPYFLFVEFFGPIIECLGYFTLIFNIFSQDVNILYSFLLLVLMIFYGSFLSVGAVLLEEWRIDKYQSIRELNRLFLFALSEAFWYRPIITYWRVKATFSILLGKSQGWGEMKRKGM
ncbi:glycosyltransferase family 2 protein [Gottfriedia acidiceleris]|uniref:Glycosyltransferase n=1 Tax=Gottfriedia acidiceleris TaxID=371036 RepID=A0ABY4JVL2_9BACI|nr:glycosyltransferase [Gottfriedia acidiceleris]UPM56360.1 glycosyltransferase [Gottfriedia acidiceleris]